MGNIAAWAYACDGLASLQPLRVPTAPHIHVVYELPRQKVPQCHLALVCYSEKRKKDRAAISLTRK